jgi:hypothetical protein
MCPCPSAWEEAEAFERGWTPAQLGLTPGSALALIQDHLTMTLPGCGPEVDTEEGTWAVSASPSLRAPLPLPLSCVVEDKAAVCGP